ncbi:MAG: META domain-containing protein [Rhodospirillales bacterium]
MTSSRWALAVAAAALAACSATGDGASTPQGRWTAQEIGGRAVAEPARTTLEIVADGRAFGIGGCNRYSGTARVSGAAIALGPMAATRMACPPPQMDQEQRFFEALATVARWRIEDRALLLLDGDGKVAVRLAPAPAG